MSDSHAASYDWGRELLKWIAVITMTVDHVGVVFFPEATIFRIIGRLAFPLFAYLLVLGLRSTRNMRAYFNRLLFFALVSQVPYALVNGIEPWVKLNIFATLILGMITIYLIERNNIAFVIPLFVSVVLPVDYGVYGTTTVLLFYLLGKDWRVGSGVFMLVNVVLAVSGAWYQPFAILTLPLILIHNAGKLTIKTGKLPGHPTLMKYFFYAYYPLHLLVLWGLKMFVV